MPSGPNDGNPGGGNPGGTNPRGGKQDDRSHGEAPSLHGLAACLALLEIEARALGQKLAAGLIAAAAEALRDPAAPSRPVAKPAPRPTAPADPRRG